MGITRAGKVELVAIIKETFTSLIGDPKFIAEILTSVKQNVNDLMDSLNAEYTNKIAEMAQDNNILRKKVDELEQYSRRYCIRVHGSPENANEDIFVDFNRIIQDKMNIVPSDNYLIYLGESLKKKWKNFRDAYSKHIRTEKTRTGQKAKSIDRYKTWHWAQQMSFIKPFLQFANTESNIDSVETLQLQDDTRDLAHSPAQSLLQCAVPTAVGTSVEEPIPTEREKL
ncbi:alcohol dehydrogenase transcription factor myb/sant-like [Holotrichia oblita]|uniref:Alcohol dehydrogenase transcription factor myb/sant-like n=1 Tax=Holotrichia oblita TaxID=644536 RepID=A0ACB9SGV2_HOLOL|nr:alcohol dehydrogenase transcription factor myb/sant-like [Holotrichia oblita]